MHTNADRATRYVRVLPEVAERLGPLERAVLDLREHALAELADD